LHIKSYSILNFDIEPFKIYDYHYFCQLYCFKMIIGLTLSVLFLLWMLVYNKI
jgi:hypothetical protein